MCIRDSGDTVPDGSEFVLGTNPLVDERSCGVWPGLAPPAPAAPATDLGGFTYFDVDGDGDRDLYASYSGGTGLFENLGNGAFGPVQHIAIEQCSLAAEPLPVDLDGDGDLDLIAFGVDAEGNLSTTFYINQQVPEPVPSTR